MVSSRSAGNSQVWFRTDEAWDVLPEEARRGLTLIDVREEAKGLRFISSNVKIEAFVSRHAEKFRPFTLFGSGDFHHLSAVWTRQFREPFEILSFDNHPDWDVRPPRWSCGAWVNRALENPRVKAVSVWGCGNFECEFPARLLGNRTAAQEGRLLVYPWAREGRVYPTWLRPLTAETWRSQFLEWLELRKGRKIYVTIDLDCLEEDEVSTNWEQGRFQSGDLIWALGEIRKRVEIIGGDMCGAWSQPQYGSAFQRVAGWFDHPKRAVPLERDRATRLTRILAKLWPALTDGKVG